MILGLIVLVLGLLAAVSYVSSKTDKDKYQNGLALSDEYLNTHQSRESVSYAIASQSLVKSTFNR